MISVLARIACALLLMASLSAQQPAQSQQQPSQQSPLPRQLPVQPQLTASSTPVPQGYRIAGTVVNALTGQPVPSASVAIAPITQGADRDISKSVTTGADGRFAFVALSRGKYSLMAKARGASLQYFEHHDPFATAIAVGPALDTDHLVFRLQPDASIEGDITDDNNEPIQNAMVRLFQASTEGGQQKTAPMNQDQTDDLGHYRIGHLAPGTYYLSVSARPWYAQNSSPHRGPGNPNPNPNPKTDPQAMQDAAALDITYPLTFYSGTTDSASATPLQLTPGEKATADVTLHAVPSLHLQIHTASAENAVLGRMVFPRISQRIFDGYLDSVFNAPVSWVAPGVIEISGLAPGHYILEMPPSTGLNDKGSVRAWYRDIDLAGDAEISASDGPSFASVSGSVFFQDVPRAPRQASLQLTNPETGETFRSDVNDRGEFDFRSDEVRPGRYVVALENTGGFFLQKLSATGAKMMGRTVDIGSTGSVRISGIASRGAAQVDGTAMREDEPFPGAMIILVPQDPANNAPLFRRDQSDSDGTFTLPNVVPGQYTVIAIANGWDLEWANPAVLQPYLKKGETVQVPVGGKMQVKVQVQ
ncbi:MAG: carboxypeptidase-like regulatory domain-containing protein [Candidatus Korobacteraceae bacterium]|jgi:5-hydroxyisourate hydrolase-like protein (transthyretin family)